MAPQENHKYNQNNLTTAMPSSNNYFIPDGSTRCIHDIQDKTLYIGILENGHNAYLVELPDLKPLLHTSRYLMDEITGQFYASYGNSYQHMCTILRLLSAWEHGQLIDELAATRHTFGCMEMTGPSPNTQAQQPHPAGSDTILVLTNQNPPPRNAPYQQASFNLDRPVRSLT